MNYVFDIDEDILSAISVSKVSVVCFLLLCVLFVFSCVGEECSR